MKLGNFHFMVCKSIVVIIHSYIRISFNWSFIKNTKSMQASLKVLLKFQKYICIICDNYILHNENNDFV